MAGLIVDANAAMEARKPWENGEYHVLLTNHKIRDASGPDKYPQVVLEFTAHEDEGDYAGKKAFRSLSASPNAIPFMVDAAIALGADPDDVTQSSVDFDAVFTELRGAECWIVTSQREYQRSSQEPVVMQTNVDRILAQPSA